MTIISNKYKFIFIHLHKCGGTSIERKFNRVMGWNDLVIGSTRLGEKIQDEYDKKFGLNKHNSAEQIKEIVSDSVWNEFYSFSIVRHPISLFESFYKWGRTVVIQRSKNDQKIISKWQKDVKKNQAKEHFLNWGAVNAYLSTNNINEFTDFCINENKLPGTFFKRLSDNKGTILVNEVFKLENITEAWKKLESLSNKKFKNAVFNKSYETEFSWNKKTLENIRIHHEIDLKTFNYE